MRPKPNTPLRRIRRAKDWTQSELAQRAGIALCTVHALEHEKQGPTWETAYRLAKALGVTPDELFPVETGEPLRTVA